MFEQPPEGIYGVCNVCSTLVMDVDKFTHPCPGFYVDYSWAAITNPLNEEWRPGFRFVMKQDSQKVGRHNYHKKARVYTIEYEIDANGEAKVRRSSPVRPTPETQRVVEAMVEKKMPKTFLTKEQLEHIVDSWADANNPVSLEIAERAKATLARMEEAE
jgi:hypothetical protein